MVSAQRVPLKSDAGKFFVKSPFLSMYFITSTVLLLFFVGLDLYLVSRAWKFASSWTLLLPPFWMSYPWLIFLENHSKLRELYEAGLMSGVESGSLKTTLQLARNTLNRVLLYSFLANAVLLVDCFYAFRHI